MTRECKQQFTLRITQANSTEMIVILYEMLLCYLEDAENALKAAEYTAFKTSVRSARGCLNELMQSLNMDYEPASNLFHLYLYCTRSLAHAEVRREEEGLHRIRKVIEPLHAAYGKLAKENHSGPVMGNSQTVYAGLTYGRNTLVENMTFQGMNRGMLA